MIGDAVHLRLRRAILLPVAVLVLALTIPQLIGAFAINVGQVAFVSILSGQAPRQLVNLLQNGSFDLLNPSVRSWLSGHVALAQGRYEDALQSLSPLDPYAAQYPLLLQDLLTAYSRTGRNRESIALYERNMMRTRPFPALNGAVALSYLDQHATGPASADDLRGVLRVRPDDLYANYHLRQLALVEGDQALADTYLNALIQFSAGAVDPTEDALVTYAVQVMPALLDEQIWDRATTTRVAEILAWRHPTAQGVAEWLQTLAQDRPLEPEWPFYLAETYHRRGELSKAAEAYEETLKREPGQLLALLQLGTIAEAQGKDEQAIGLYEEYHQRAPDDSVGLTELIAVSERLGRPNAPQLRAKLANLLDDRAWVASQLGRSLEEVSLGPSMAANASFEQWQGNGPDAWASGAYLGASGREGLYASGSDRLPLDKPALRITALRGGRLGDGTVTYSEYGGQPFAVGASRYLVSLLYRAEYNDGVGLFLLGQYTDADGVIVSRFGLPSTERSWKRLRVLTDATTLPTFVSPLVRNWGLGDLSIASVDVRPVTVQDATQR